MTCASRRRMDADGGYLSSGTRAPPAAPHCLRFRGSRLAFLWPGLATSVNRGCMSAYVHSPPACLLACCVLLAACKLYEQDADAAPSAGPCVETNEPLTPALSERVSVDPSLLLDKVRGRRAHVLHWSTGQRTEIAFVLTDPEIYYVRSRVNPQLSPLGGGPCTSRTEIRGSLAVNTADGQLAEKQDVVLVSNGSDEAHGLVSVSPRRSGQLRAASAHRRALPRPARATLCCSPPTVRTGHSPRRPRCAPVPAVRRTTAIRSIASRTGASAAPQ